MRVYVASSWRNAIQPAVVEVLRMNGHQVYDFRNPHPGDTGFSWRECSSPEELCDPAAFRDRVLTSEPAQRGFRFDMEALKLSEATVLLLPCGRSAHLEFGYACGAGQRTIILLDDPLSEPELMYLAADRICTTIEEVKEALR